MKLIQISQTGGPEVMQYVDAPIPTPGPKQALVRIAATGVNFIDVYFRIGLYKADLPFTPGNEAAGTVEAVGAEVTEVKPGDRVAYAMNRGSYAEYTVVPAATLVKLPDDVGFDVAAAAMLQGMTAHYLTHSSYPLKKGDTCLVHAAAGGAGRLVVQMAKMLGATVYGTAGTDEKAAIAKSAGADEVIVYTKQDFVAEVKRLTGGKGLDVIYDSVGATTFLKGLDLLRPRGMMVLFGQSSGAVAPFDPSILNQKGSLFLARPSLAHHCLTRDELLWRAGDVLGWIGSGKLELRIEKTYKLSDAPQAHRDLEGRRTAGKLLLEP
ncbi:MAG: quinone oxidoreductase [Acidobacteriota bacterium]|nr:quinone oxidoreductase [Acidobacteriota bacterium]